MSNASDYANNVSRILESSANARAAATRENGQIWAQGLGALATGLANAPILRLQQQEAQQRRQITQYQLESAQKAQQTQQRANQIIAGLQRNPDGTYDTGSLIQQLSGANTPPDEQEQYVTSIERMNQVIRSFTTTKNEHIADLADSILKDHPGTTPITPETVHMGFAVMKASGLATDADEQKMVGIMSSGMAPRTVLEQIRREGSKYQAAQAKANEPYTLAPGATRNVGSQVIASNAPRITNEAELLMAAGDPANPQSAQAQAALALKAKTPDGAKAGSFEDYVLRYAQDKNKTVAQLNPKDIEDARKRYQQADDKPRITVNAGGDGALTSDAVEYTATAYRLLGTRAIPTRISGNERIKILNQAAQQSKALGQSPAMAVTKQLTTKADGAALTQVEKMAASADGFESKALSQIDIIKGLSSKVARTKYPIINGVLQSGRTAIAGDEDATKLANAIETFSEEYAKLMAGSTGSSAAASDSTRAASKRLINAAMGKGTMAGVLDLMATEMRLTKQGYDVAKEHITDRIGGAGASSGNTADPLGILK